MISFPVSERDLPHRRRAPHRPVSDHASVLGRRPHHRVQATARRHLRFSLHRSEIVDRCPTSIDRQSLIISSRQGDDVVDASGCCSGSAGGWHGAHAGRLRGRQSFGASSILAGAGERPAATGASTRRQENGSRTTGFGFYPGLPASTGARLAAAACTRTRLERLRQGGADLRDGEPSGPQTYRITIEEGTIVDRRRVGAEDNCDSESYEPI